MSASQLTKLIRLEPPELLIHDEFGPCPYLPEQTCRLPLRLPARALSPGELDRRLRMGDRRQGALLYRPACPDCQACEPIRLDAGVFAPGKTHRRILRKGDAELRMEIGPPVADERRVELYNAHKAGRGLRQGERPIDLIGYRAFLTETCCETFEVRYFQGDELVAVAITDRGAESLSAVYCYFDPAIAQLSPGTYSILKQLELCREWGLQYLYLGLFIEDCDAMRYKGRFVPHERLLHGRWGPPELSAKKPGQAG